MTAASVTVVKKEGLAVAVRDAAPVLPAYQRVQFGILVDLGIDAAHQAGRIKARQMFRKIGVTALGSGHELLGAAGRP